MFLESIKPSRKFFQQAGQNALRHGMRIKFTQTEKHQIWSWVDLKLIGFSRVLPPRNTVATQQ
ncbi:MAG TPA: hypothetical protein DCQ77_11035 [Betaproteobacteria bacterium]|nr:hypothetical protein [Betaproteobacteria bacterium]